MRPQRSNPDPAPRAWLWHTASGTVPAQCHRPCPNLSCKQEVLAPTFLVRKGDFGQQGCFSSIESICLQEGGQGKQGGSRLLGPPITVPKSGVPAGRMLLSPYMPQAPPDTFSWFCVMAEREAANPASRLPAYTRLASYFCVCQTMKMLHF